MGAATLHFGGVSFAWQNLRHKLTGVSTPGCVHLENLWRRLRSRRQDVLLNGSRYCADRSLEPALLDAFERVRSIRKRTVVPHRIPLGLLLISRQQLTPEQLRTALSAQRGAGRGRLGEWLLALGFVTEEKITAALARQWSCPVLRTTSLERRTCRSPQVPATLLESFAMIPLDYTSATSTLHVAFSEGIDHSLLYAIERMTETRTAPCLAPSSFVRANLQSFSRDRRENELVFEGATDTSECCRIIRSYSLRLCIGEIRLAGCGPYVWVRLLRDSRAPMDLLFRTDTGRTSSIMKSAICGNAG
jgi:hypothetical protein